MARFGNVRILGPRGAFAGRRPAGGLTTWGLLAVAVMLLVTSRVDDTLFDRARGHVIAWSAPVFATTSAVIAPVTRAISRLTLAAAHWRDVAPQQAEIARLSALAIKVDDLERENRELKRIAGFSAAPVEGRVTARVVARAPGPLSHTLLINAGRNQAVGVGNPVMGGDGLVGRIIQAQGDYASIMLLGDRLSRVPVEIGEKHVRAVLTGTGGASPRLEFVGPDAPIIPGDLISTSGLGGMFPRGLAVGQVVGDGAGWRVALIGDPDAVGTVTVLLVDLPGLDGAAPRPIRGERQAAVPRAKDVVK